MTNIFDLSLNDFSLLMSSWGQPSFHANQLWEGLYKQLYTLTTQFTSLPKPLQVKLAAHFDGSIHSSLSSLEPVQVLRSSDGETIKTLFRLPDNLAIEAVLMRYARRRTLCISTQAGCAMGCVFCATGQMGFQRQLTSGEIVEQVLYYARQLAGQGERVTNVVIMGMGEPFHNYDSTMDAIDRLNHPHGYNFGARRFTISTVGLIPAIQRFTQEHSQVNLAISLHAASDELRSRLLPINNKYPLDYLFSTCLEYIRITHRRITFEWALIEGVNDSIAEARQLATRLAPFKHDDAILCHVNIIPLNPTTKYAGRPTTKQQAEIFRDELGKFGIPCTIRLRRGIDIQAGCGQLATQVSGNPG